MANPLLRGETSSSVGYARTYFEKTGPVHMHDETGLKPKEYTTAESSTLQINVYSTISTWDVSIMN